MDQVEPDTQGFTPIYIITQLSGVLVVVLTGVWMSHFQGGFSFSEASIVFNWHPILMVLSMVYIYGNGILIYRIFRHERKRKLKYTHAIVMVSALVLALAGLKAVLDSHNYAANGPIPNFYSLHSWLGILTIIFFLLQWLGGLITFLFPGLASHLRSSFLPIHVFSGMLIFTMACATALLGITEKAIFSIKDYKEKGAEGTLVNWIGLLICIFGVLVIYLTTNSRFKRLNRPEDEMLLAETANE